MQGLHTRKKCENTGLQEQRLRCEMWGGDGGVGGFFTTCPRGTSAEYTVVSIEWCNITARGGCDAVSSKSGRGEALRSLIGPLLSRRIWPKTTESVAMLPPFSPIEGQKWFDQISSQWESQKNRFALIYFGKIQFLPPCIWNLPFMSAASVLQYLDSVLIFFSRQGNDDMLLKCSAATMQTKMRIKLNCNF
jgi:hypothetical protein